MTHGRLGRRGGVAGLDILVNNAGSGARQTLLTAADMETFDRVFALNVRGVYNLTRLLAPALIEAQGNIVNVSSIAGSAVYTGALPYSMSKAALDHFTNLIALELAPKGVRVNAVSPGFTVSKFVQRLTGCSEEEYTEYLRESEQTIPLGQVCTSEEIAESIAWLAGPAAAKVTGTNISVDGGARFSLGAANTLQKQKQAEKQ
ncbi:enoyl-(Acyl carrier protein) reductase domain-containing protein [Phthorimaea operculella]|nr:enoyl-(Acyl carrier protein) reductase domain-containing protein [Phthorimaea operculella]